MSVDDLLDELRERLALATHRDEADVVDELEYLIEWVEEREQEEEWQSETKTSLGYPSSDSLHSSSLPNTHVSYWTPWTTAH